MNKYFYEYGAVQEKTENGPRRIIECEGSANQPVKISQELGCKIAVALEKLETAQFVRDANSAQIFEALTHGDINLDDLAADKFDTLLRDLPRIYTARVMNCVDASGKNDREWNLLSRIFDRIQERK